MCDYPTAGMNTVLGLFGIAVFIVALLALSALVTFAVVRLTPQRKPKPESGA
jgi:hypothetical protein